MSAKQSNIQRLATYRHPCDKDIHALRTPGELQKAMLVRALTASYSSLGCVNHVDGKNLPSKAVIADIARDLLQLLFPGFFESQAIHSSAMKDATSVLLGGLRLRLTREIGKSLKHAPPDGVNQADLSRLGQKQTLEFLNALPRVRELLETDTTAAYEGDPAALSKEEVIAAYPFIEAIAIQRLAHELYLMKVPLIPRMMTEWAHSRTGIDLHPGAQVGSHFFIDHGAGTVVGETAEIGNRVKLYQGVGLIARSLAAGRALRGQKRHPAIRDRVTIYAGATVVGGDTVIGEGSTIGASVFLTTSVPPNSLVLLQPANVRVIAKIAG